MSTEYRKVTVTLPKELLERLNQTVPSRKRSSFITGAIKEQLELTEQRSAWQKLPVRGHWKITQRCKTMQV